MPQCVKSQVNAHRYLWISFLLLFFHYNLCTHYNYMFIHFNSNLNRLLFYIFLITPNHFLQFNP
jgi:hypothetical protein